MNVSAIASHTASLEVADGNARVCANRFAAWTKADDLSGVVSHAVAAASLQQQSA